MAPQSNARTAVLFAIAVSPWLASCTPTFSVFGNDAPAKGQGDWEGPTVKVLVNHLTCELVDEYHAGILNSKDPDQADLWKKLSADHFVAATDLNLVVTQIEGLNPGYSAITPLNALGQSVPIVTKSGFASGSYNQTLAIGGQLNGTQDNTIDLTYVIDMNRIADEVAYEYLDARGTRTLDPDWHTGMPDCRSQDNDDKHHGLRGSLELGTNIDEVLTGIDASGGVNIYGSSTPPPPDEAPPPNAGGTTTTPGTGPSTPTTTGKLLKALAAVSSKPGGGGTTSGGGGTSSSTGFSFKIDFTILAGLSGGPSWTLLQSKYPAGGGSSAQLLNYSHQTVDTLTVTFAPTCTSPSALEGETANGQTLPDFYVSEGKSGTTLHVRTGIDPDSLAAINVAGVLGTSSLGNGGLIFPKDAKDDRSIGTIAWTGYVESATKSGDQKSKSMSVVLSGVVTKNATQRPVGRIVVHATIVATKSGTTWSSTSASVDSVQVNSGELVALLSDKRLSSFWDTIPPCDTLSGPAIQNIWDAAASQAQLFKLTSGLTSH